MANDDQTTPQRRLEDHHPDTTIDWSKPGAPVVPQSSTPVPRVGGITSLEGLTRYEIEQKMPGVWFMSKDSSGDYLKFADIERLFATQAQAAAPATDEPVAWMYRDDAEKNQPGTGSCFVTITRNPIYRNGIPLYAHPTAPVQQPKSHPFHRDLEGLNAFIEAYCNGDDRLIACAESAWYVCMDRNGAAQVEPVAIPAGSENFADWLVREMPPGTVINDPAWWAPRILRAVGAAPSEQLAAPEQADGDTVIARLPEIHTALIQAYRAGALRSDGNGIDAGAYAEAERVMRAWDLPDAPAGEAQAEPVGVDTKLLVDIATAVMGSYSLLDAIGESETERFCVALNKRFDNYFKGADLAAPTEAHGAAIRDKAPKLSDEGSFYEVARARGFTDFGLTISGKYSDEKLQKLSEQYDAEASTPSLNSEGVPHEV